MTVASGDQNPHRRLATLLIELYLEWMLVKPSLSKLSNSIWKLDFGDPSFKQLN